MKSFKMMAAIILGISSFFARAEEPPAPKEPSFYACTIMIFAADLPNGFAEKKFEAPVAASGPHGGDTFDFPIENYSVSLFANGRWLGISWFKGTEMITQSIFLRQFNSWEAQVLMAFNPKDTEEYASLDCTPQ